MLTKSMSVLPLQHREPYGRHVGLVDMVATIAPPTPSWAELRNRFDHFMAMIEEAPLQQRLVEAIIDGPADADIPLLRAMALAESYPERADSIIAVRSAVYPRLVEYYAKVARSNYGKVAAEFDRVAAAFTTAAGRCDPDADTADVVTQPDATRDAWLDAAKHAHKLDELSMVLCAAAELCGLPIGDDTALLPLCVDTTGLHRRRVWEAWRAEARTRRWGALTKLGARIRAAGLDGFEFYREPKPLIRKQFPVGGPDGRGIYRPEYIDPEDADYQPPVEEPKRRPALAR